MFNRKGLTMINIILFLLVSILVVYLITTVEINDTDAINEKFKTWG